MENGKTYRKIILILFLPGILVFAQDFSQYYRQIDSLKYLASIEKDQKKLADIYNEIPEYYRITRDPDSILIYSTKAFNISTKLDYKKGIAYSLLNKCYYSRLVYNRRDYFQNITQAANLFEKLDDKKGLGLSYLYWGNYYAKYLTPVDSYPYYVKAEEIFISLKDTISLGWTYIYIGQYYGKLNDFNNSNKYYYKSEEIAEKCNNPGILFGIYALLAYNYLGIGRPDLAVETIVKNTKYLNSIKNNNLLSDYYYDLGFILFEARKINEAIKVLEKALLLADKKNNENLLSAITSRLGECYFEKKNYRKAYLFQKDNYKFRVEYTDRLNHEALETQKYIYEVEKKAESETLENKIQNQQLILLSISASLFLIIALVVYYMYRQKVRHNSTLERKVRERTEELNTAKEIAESSERLKSVFLSQMSHEVRTPLNAVINLSGILNEEYENLDDKDRKDIIGSIKRSGDRIIRTIEMILNYSEIISGTYRPIFKEISIKKICSNVLEETKYYAQVRNLDVNYQGNGGECLIYGDEYSIHSILKNVIENAIIYTERGRIEIKIMGNNNNIIFSCRDTGIGISDEYKSKLFLPFSQEELGYSRKYEGLGLGLALSRFYCDLNRAQITCDSQKGNGSVFNVLFQKAK